MKKFAKIKFLLLFAVAFSLVQCTADSDNFEQAEDSIESNQVSEEILAGVKKLGFDGKTVTDNGKSVVIDGYLEISKERLSELTSGKQAYYRSASVIDCDKVRNIKIAFNINNSFIRSAFPDAVKLWNDIPNTTLRFTIVDANQNPDITFVPAITNRRPSYRSYIRSFPKKQAFRAKWPSFGTPRRIITLNPTVLTDIPLTKSNWRNIMASAIGSIIGLVDSNRDTPGGVYEHIAGTVYSDANSIVNHRVSSGNLTARGSYIYLPGLSQNDKAAVQFLYNDGPNSICK